MAYHALLNWAPSINYTDTRCHVFERVALINTTSHSNLLPDVLDSFIFIELDTWHGYWLTTRCPIVYDHFLSRGKISSDLLISLCGATQITSSHYR